MIKNIVQAALGRFGLRLIRTDNIFQQIDGVIPFFAALKNLGFAPRHIVDVGANRGNWTRQALRFFPNAHYTLVEPQADLEKYIRDLVDLGSDIQWINAGVGSQVGILPLTISSRDDSSSFVPTQEEATSGGHKQILVPVKTLNEIVASSGAGVPDMVKIDAEGFDLKILSGASDLFGRTEIFLAEAIIFGRNDENTLSAVMAKMVDAGYAMIDITALNRSPKTGLLWLCEVAFIRHNSPLLEHARIYE